MTIYCGNNALSEKGKKHKFGTPYECFRKGINIGQNTKVPSQKYEPIDKRKIYCGTNKKLPDGYDYMGNSTQCLRKGIGVGISLRSKSGHSYKRSSKRGSRRSSKRGSRRGSKRSSKRGSRRR